jgi:hypothetical protein
MTVDDATVMMTGLVCRIRMQMQERRGRRRHLEADTHEPHETEAFHLCRIVAHILKPVKNIRMSTSKAHMCPKSKHLVYRRSAPTDVEFLRHLEESPGVERFGGGLPLPDGSSRPLPSNT